MTSPSRSIDAVRRWLEPATDVFHPDGRWRISVLLAFALVNSLVFYNALKHDPRYGYDAPGHLAYVRTLATGRLPTPEDSHEFFSPPLPYVPAAVLWHSYRGDESIPLADQALKRAQLVQACFSVVLTFALLKLGRRVAASAFLLTVMLLCLGMLPPYYRTFVMIRGEPMLATLGVVAAYLAVRTFGSGRRPTIVGGLLVGLALGLAVLCRQWAFFLLPPLGLLGLWRLWADVPARAATLRSGIAVTVAFAASGLWYYAYLQHAYGSFRAFNRQPHENVVDEPPTPSRTFPEALRLLATRPVRHAFADRPLMLFYADLWGDYWEYYLVYARDRRGRMVKPVNIEETVATGGARRTNLATMPPYLGRVSVVSIAPTLALLAGVGTGLAALRRWAQRVELDVAQAEQCAPARTLEGIVVPLAATLVLSSLAGYAWFIASYPHDHFDTVKASYPLQVYPFAALATAAMLTRVRGRHPRVAWAVVIVLVVVLVHNGPTLITRYTKLQPAGTPREAPLSFVRSAVDAR